VGLISAPLGSLFRIRVSTRRREKRVGGLVRGQPCFEALAQGKLFFAHSVQENYSLVSRFSNDNANRAFSRDEFTVAAFPSPAWLPPPRSPPRTGRAKPATGARRGSRPHRHSIGLRPRMSRHPPKSAVPAACRRPRA